DYLAWLESRRSLWLRPVGQTTRLASVSVLTSGSVSAGFVVALWLPDTLEAEAAAAVVESALADRTSQVAFPTLPGQGRGSHQWVIHHPDSLSMMEGLIDPLPPTLRAIAPQWLQQCVHRKHFPNAERMAGSTTTSRNVMTQIGTTTGIGAMHISITVTSLSLSTASGAD